MLQIKNNFDNLKNCRSHKPAVFLKKGIMSKIFVACLFLLMTLGLRGQGILFYKGSFEDALKESQKQDKMLFVDVYADWCGPCKALSERVFPMKDVGAYFNDRFVCYKMNADLGENKSLMEKYKIKGMPTLLFVNAKGDVVKQHMGFANSYLLLRLARQVTGEYKTPKQMYALYKKDKNNLSVQQAILLDAPYFMPELKSVQRDRWNNRLKSIYEDYLENKPLSDMVNQKDFNLLTLFHNKIGKKDEIVDFMIDHFSDYLAHVDTMALSQYLTTMHLNSVIELARGGDKDYAEILKRMTGDMKSVYRVISQDPDAYYTMYKLIADANYLIYHQKDTPEFIKLMDKFLQMQEKPQAKDYMMAVETLFNGLKGKLEKDGYEKSLLWLDKALKFELDINTQTGIVMTMGDCFYGLSNQKKAKESYNQAYLLTLKMKNTQNAMQFQQMIKTKLSQLN